MSAQGCGKEELGRGMDADPGNYLMKGVSQKLLRLNSFLRFVGFALLAWFLSERRREINMRDLLTGLGLQISLAVLLLKLLGSQHISLFLNKSVEALADSTKAGTLLCSDTSGVQGFRLMKSRPVQVISRRSRGSRWCW